jgi:exonuclease SbcC
MIPQRLKISGFLSYKDEQEIRFDEAPLWMLSGTNGSGKSSVFDAVTFALFGHHRGGSQSAAELVNKESKTLAVEFDFTSEKQLYRIKRTVRLREKSGIASTQQVLKHTHSEIAGETWEAISGTEYKKEFDAWIRDKIGLDYETFTSSVLLLQGKAEKLLDSTPAGRAGVLARIVDLERYQKLHSKADDKRRSLKSQLEAITDQLSSIREVNEDEYANILGRIAEAEVAREDTLKRIDDLNSLESRARLWTETQTKLSAARGKLEDAERVLGNAAAIQKDYTRLGELRNVLPSVTTIVSERGRIRDSESKTTTLTEERAETERQRDQNDHKRLQAQSKRDNLKKTINADEKKRTEISDRLRELASVIQIIKQVEAAETEIQQLESELQSLPPDAEATVAKLQREQERLTLLAQQVSLLERLHQDRASLTKAKSVLEDSQKAEAKLKADGVKAKKDFANLETKAKAAREERAAKDQAMAEVRALARHARELADEFKTMNGQTKCRACGQKLTPEHFASEKTTREAEAKKAEAKLAQLTQEAETAREREKELTANEASERTRLNDLRDKWKDADAAVKQASKDIDTYTNACQQTYYALPDEFKRKCGTSEPTDWATVEYPNRQQLTELNAEARGIDSVKRKLKAAQDEAKKVSELTAKCESARERLSRARRELGTGDIPSLRAEYSSKQSEEKSLANSITATKKTLEDTEKEIERYTRAFEENKRELTEIDGKLTLEVSTRKQSNEAIDRAKKTLPPEWQAPLETAGFKDRAKWQDEYDALVAAGTEAKYTRLQVARGGLDPLRAEITQLEAEAETFAPTERRKPEDVRAEVATARREHETRNKELLNAQSEQRILDGYKQQRAELAERFKTVDAEHNRHKTLAELLGRDRLQRHLVRQAERQIVDYANAVLDRLSGGQLFMRLVEAETGTDKALDLECANRVTGGAAINVAFLSGSQRFRVAVALALGIGQYASKQHRPIESVIIDEGFGCLDRAGRQVMIQELQNLRGHLHCILLVSHQEEFADAFPDGYRFELQNGATRVSRFVR